MYRTIAQKIRKGNSSAHAKSERNCGKADMKRIPLIKFPPRHPKPSGKTLKTVDVSVNEDIVRKVFTRAPSSTLLGGKASDQPKRTPVTQEEIDAVLLGGCF